MSAQAALSRSPARGPRAVEAALLDALREDQERVRADPRLLAQPLVLIVPSHSLREHLIARCVAEFGSLAGVRIDTLRRFASSVLEHASSLRTEVSALLPVMAERAARRVKDLATDTRPERLAPWLAALRDLFDAGFEAHQLPAALEALEGLPRASAARARIVLEFAAELELELARAELLAPGGQLRAAAELLSHDSTALAARAVWIHGFADATGAASELCECLVARSGTRVFFDALVFDLPGVSAGQGFGLRLAQCLGVPRSTQALPALVPDAHIVCFSANDPAAELRTVARRVHGLLARGVRPESIGIVARELDPLRLPLRAALRAFAVPFSGVGTRGAIGATERRLSALADLLEQGGRAAFERWLDASALVASSDHEHSQSAVRADLALALHVCGAGRLDEVAGLDLALRLGRADHLVLPVRRGARLESLDGSDAQELAEGEASDELTENEDDPHADLEPSAKQAKSKIAFGMEHRRAPRALLESACRAAARWIHVLLEPEREERAHDLFARWRAFTASELAWPADSHAAVALEQSFLELETELPLDFRLRRREFCTLLAQILRRHARSTLGGAGAGVACLSAMEARGRTFEHVFVVGLVLGVFPRLASEDPVLDATARAALQAIWPDLPLKSDAFSEERWLFEALLRCAPEITLSWPRCNADGRVLPLSPLVERWLAGAERAVHAVDVSSVRCAPTNSGGTQDDELPLPLAEHLTRAGLAHGRAGLAALLPLACGAELAQARLASLEEWDPPRTRAFELGPFSGLVGAITHPQDARRATLYVTTLEAHARCGWQTFLTRALRLERLSDPLGALEGIGGALLGTVVHAALEEFLAGSASLEAFRPRLYEIALAAVRARALAIEGLAQVLAQRAAAYLERVRERIDLGNAPFVGSEVELELSLGNGQHLAARADLEQRMAAGRLLTDFKTGRPLSDNVKAETRRKKWLALLARGEQLQALAYALAAGAKARGRYVYLAPDLDPLAPEFECGADDVEFVQAFEHSTGALLDAWEKGAFVARLWDDKLAQEPPACKLCEVAVACVRHDSAARQRQRMWIKANSAESHASARAARAVFDLRYVE